MDTFVFDAKEKFKDSINELEPIIHLEYGGKRLAFSGFEIWGRSFGKYPIFVHLDNDKREANVFFYLDGGMLQLSFWRYINTKLEKVGYRVRHLRTEVENGFIFS